MTYTPAADRYEKMTYRKCGNSGLQLPAISLGLWHNFGGDTPHDTKVDICRTAFDNGSCIGFAPTDACMLTSQNILTPAKRKSRINEKCRAK